MNFEKKSFTLVFLVQLSLCSFSQSPNIIGGVVLNKKNNEPVAYAHVGIIGTSIGTSTNIEGKFVLNIPSEFVNDTLFISHLSFKTYYFGHFHIKNDSLPIFLEEHFFNLNEVVVLEKGITPFEVLKEAIDSTNLKSYSPVILHTYHREFSKKNEQFNYFADALIDYYIEGKKKSDIEVRVNESRARRVKIKLDEGFDHNFSHAYDIKSIPNYCNAERILKFINEDLCDINLTEVTNKNNDTIIRIKFTPKTGQNKQFCEGIVYIDKETLIIQSYEVHISDSHRNFTPEANLFLLHGKLSSIFVQVQYSILAGKCYLNRVRLDGTISMVNRKKINVNYQFISEMTATGISAENIKSFDRKERFNFNQLYYMAGNNNGNNFKTSFWKNQNGLLATKEEEEVIERLSKRQLKRNK